MNSFIEEIRKYPIVMIYRGLDPEECLKLTEVLMETGIRFFEVTMNTPGAIETIKLLNKRFDNDIHVGAGTVLNVEQVYQVEDVGGKYIISPNLNEEVVRTTKQLGLNSIPGAFTPTEVIKAWETGADMVKIFPVNVVGTEYIKQLRGPIQDIPFMATGGVKLDTVKDLFTAGTDAIGMSVHLLGKELVEEKNWAALQDNAKRFTSAAGFANTLEQVE